MIATCALLGALLAYVVISRGAVRSVIAAAAFGIVAAAILSGAAGFWLLAVSPTSIPFQIQLDAVLRIFPVAMIVAPLAAIAGARRSRGLVARRTMVSG